MSKLQKSIEIVSDLFTEVDASDFKTKQEKNIFLGLKTVSNIIQALDAQLEVGVGNEADKAKAKGKAFTALKLVKAIIGQIKNIDSESPALQLVHAACADLLTSLGEVAEIVKKK